MTDQRSRLDQHAAAFGAALSSGASRQRARRRRRQRAAAYGVPLVAAASLLIAFWPGEQATVLERATAALSPDGEVIHYRIATQPIGFDDVPCPIGPVDIWTEVGSDAGKFPRWRARTSLPARCDGHGTTSALGFVNTGRSDRWFDGRNTSEFAPDDGWVEHITDVTDVNKRPPGIGATLDVGDGEAGLDAISWLRWLLRQGIVHEAGEGVVDGRSVRFLRGEITRQPSPDVSAYRFTLRIAVDRSSFEPVEILQRFDRPAGSTERSGSGRSAVRIRFLEYSTAPVNELAPRLPPGTRSASIDYRELRKIVRRTRRYPIRSVTDAERARADARLAASGRRPTP